jgi:cell division transport system permease protein
MLLALLIVGVTASAFVKARAMGADIQRDAGVVKVFLAETASDEQVNALRIDLEKNANVEKVDYISKTEALARAKKLFKNTPDIFENIPGNPFPQSLEATLKDPEQMNAVAKTVDGQPGVDEVKTGGEDAQRLITIIKFSTAAMFAVGIGILIAATVLVANTIRLSIYARRREIEVMKLVGASNGFVRMPFMIEGFLVGAFSALLAMLAVFGIVFALAEMFASLVQSPQVGATAGELPLGVIAIGLLVLGITLGMLGSAFSMRKYLRT